MSHSGRVLSVRDQGSIWQLLYERDGEGLGVVNFDWRSFANLYEGESGRSFAGEYAVGAGAHEIQRYFRDRRIQVEGEGHETRVWFE